MINNISCYQIWSWLINEMCAYIPDSSKSKPMEAMIYQAEW